MSTRVRLLYGSERYGFFTGPYAHAQVLRDALLRGIDDAARPPAEGLTKTAFTIKLYKQILVQKATGGKKLMVWRVPRRVRNCEYRVKVRKYFPKALKAARDNRGRFAGRKPNPAPPPRAGRLGQAFANAGGAGPVADWIQVAQQAGPQVQYGAKKRP